MCGIVGAISQKKDVSPILIEGLQRLEYRGYDSAGIATLVNGKIERRRATALFDGNHPHIPPDILNFQKNFVCASAKPRPLGLPKS